METKTEVVKVIISSQENLITGLQICAEKNALLEEAILGRISDVLNEIAKKAETEKSPLKVRFKPYDSFDPRGDKIDWGFSFLISSDRGQTVGLKYTFDNWDLKNLYYGIDQNQTTREGISNKPIFGSKNENWPWGWNWMNGYLNWDCKTVSDLLDEIRKEGLNSNFAQTILMSIRKAADLIKEY